MSRENPSGRDRGPASPLSYVGLGAELIAPILVGTFGGVWLDRRFGTTPWWTLIGSVLGVVSGLWSFLRRTLPPRA